MPAGRILIVDDDLDTLEDGQRRLGREGYQVEIARDPQSALAKLAEVAGWDVVLLDVKLRGSEGPDIGLDLLADIQARAPFARVILMSGLAGEATVWEAFEKGAHDYIEKGRLFWPLLSVKVRGAIELARERRLAATEDKDRQHLLEQLYHDAVNEQGRQRKGLILEELMLLLFRSIPGFEHVAPQVRSSAEEIDIVIRNQSIDPVWSRQCLFILVECKNWSHPTERKELDAFTEKFRRRGSNCKLGFFVALGGFSKGFKETAARLPMQGIVVVPLGPEDVQALVLAKDRQARSDRLKDLYERAALQV